MIRRTRGVQVVLAVLMFGPAVSQLRAAEAPAAGYGPRYRAAMLESLAGRREEMQRQDAAWRSLPSATREEMLKSIRERAERESIEIMKSAEKAPDDPLADCPFRGLLRPDEVTVLFH